MQYKLYYADKSAAMGIRALLEALGQSYELIATDISYDKPRDPELLQHNPNGWVPVLLDEHGAVFEGGAITVYLCDRHVEMGLAPRPDGPMRGQFLQWLFFFASSVQNAYQMTYYPDRFCTSPDDHASVRQRSATRLGELWRVIDDAIGDNKWMLGDEFSALDIHLYMLSIWRSDDHHHPKINQFKHIHRVVEQAAQEPCIRRVYHD